MRAWLAVVVLVGCGRLHFDADARSPDGATTVACGPWQPPTEVTAVNTSNDDWDPAISPDGNVLVLARPIAMTRSDVFVAMRQGNTFTTPAPIAAINDGGRNAGLMWSSTGDAVYFVSDRITPLDFRLYQSTYSAGTFGPPVIVAELANTYANGPCMRADGLELYYEGATIIERAERSATDQPWAITGRETQLTPAPPLYATFPALSADGLTLYLEVTDGSGSAEIWSAQRTSTSERFGTPQMDAEIAAWPDVGRAGDPDPAHNNAEMFIAVDRASLAGGYDIMISSRTCN